MASRVASKGRGLRGITIDREPPDMIAVYMACDGERVALVGSEIREAVLILIKRGEMSGLDIARQLGVSDQTVYRHKKALMKSGRLGSRDYRSSRR